MTPVIHLVAPPERSHECFPDASADKFGAGTIWECPKCERLWKVVNSVFEIGHAYWVVMTKAEVEAVRARKETP